MKKSELSQIISILLHFHNHSAIWKRVHFDTESLLIKLREIVRRRGVGIATASSRQKNILNYITSRNMRKTITPSYLNKRNASDQNDNAYPVNVNEIINLISFKWHQSKNLFSLATCTSILKFHTTTGLLGNLITKKPQGTAESHVEDEESWGGPEAFKLVVFLKDDFDDVVKKHASMIVFFHAYWCPHCLRLKKPYGTTALMAKEAKLPMAFGAFDVTANPDIADEKGVVGIPVIKYYEFGKYISTYAGKRTAEALFEFVKNPPQIPPPSELKRPDV